MALPQLRPWVVSVVTHDVPPAAPVAQCIGIKQMGQNNAGSNAGARSGTRYRLGLSDGEVWCSGMLATQLNHYVTSNQITEGTYMRLDEMCVSDLNGRKVVVILNLQVLSKGPPLGTPTSIEKMAAGPPAPQVRTPLANAQQPPQANGYGQPPAQGAVGGAYGAPPQNNAYGAPPQGNAYGPGGGSYGAPAGGAYGAPQQQGAYGRGGGGYGAAAGGYAPQAPSTPNYRAGSAPVARDEAPPRIVPIQALNAYQARWTLKARVSQKSDLRRYSNVRGEGRFFSFDLIDSENGEIRCTAFNEACDRFFERIQEGRVYTLTKASVRPKKPGSNYNQTKHDHEIMLENQTQIQEVTDDDADMQKIPRMLYSFKRIEEVENTPPKAMIDVIGVIESVDAWTTITKKDGTDTTKRAIVIRDQSNRSVELTMWGEYAMNPGEQLEQNYKDGKHPILAVKGARVGDFNGRTLSTVSSSNVAIDPDIPEAGTLRHWYDSAGGAQSAAAPLTDPNRTSGGGKSDRRVFLDTIREEQLGCTGQPAYVQINGTVTFIQTDRYAYPACTLSFGGRQCNKKLQAQGDNEESWWCERCQNNCSAEWRYILSAQVSDHTGQHWLTAFQEAAPDLMCGISAGDLRALSNQEFDAQIFRANFTQHILKLRIAEESYQDETRVKVNVNKVEPLDFVRESRLLLDYIGRLQRNEPLAPAAPAPADTQPAGNFGGGAGYSRGTPQRQGGGAYGGGYNSNYGNNVNNGYGGGPGTNTGYGNAGGYGGGGAGGYGSNTYSDNKSGVFASGFM